MAKKREWTADETAEIIRRYDAGDSAVSIGEMFSVAESTIRKHLRRNGIAIRHSCIVPSPLASMTREKLSDLYGPASDYKSIRAIARDYGCDECVISRLLIKYGIRRRSMSEQKRIDVKLKRYPHPGPLGRRGGSFTDEARAKGCAASQSPTARAKSAANHRRPVSAPCGWCGVVIVRKKSLMIRRKNVYCTLSHSNKNRYHDPSLPRPLIAAKLYDLWRTDPRRSMHGPTIDLLQKLGEPIGAKDLEIEAVMDRWFEENGQSRF